MSIRLSSRKTLAVALSGLLLAGLLFVWQFLPRLLQAQAEEYIASKTGHRLTLDRPEINPFDLSLRLSNLRLAEPDGKPLLAFRELKVDLSAASLVRRALVFDAVRLEGPQATVAVRRDGRLNWSALVDALKDKEKKPDSPLPRLDIRSFVLAGGSIEFSDDKAAFASRIDPIEVELGDISTLPDDKGRYKLSARTATHTRVLWQGEATLNPLSLAGTLEIQDVDLARMAPYLKDVLPTAPAGMAALTTGYRVAYAAGRLDLILDDMTASLAGLRLDAGGAAVAVDRIEARNGRFDLAGNKLTLGALTLTDSAVDLPHPGGAPVKLLRLGSLTLADAAVDLAARSLALGRVALKDGRLQAVRNAHGDIDVVAAVQAVARPAARTPPDAQAKPTPWRYQVKQLELAGFSAALRDETTTPAAELVLEDIALAIDGIDDKLAAALPIRAAFRAREGGSFEAAGQILPAVPAADLRVKLADLALKPAQPYLASVAQLTLASGRLSADGRVTYGKRGSGFAGGFALRDLRLVETATDTTFLAWKTLGSRDLELAPAKLGIGELVLDGLDTSLIIAKDKSVNVSRVLRKPDAAVPAAAPEAAADKRAPAFVANIDRLRLSNGEMDFADDSLALPFATRIHELRGVVNGLSSRSDAPAQIELDGQVDDYGLARIVGQVDLSRPGDFMDLKVVFRNVEMTRLTPYAATFAGRKIDSGKLSLDLEYKIKKRQLAGENKVVIERLTLGERVDSPTARNLPLDLAIAILQDSDGRIDLGLPVSGSLDDPQFSYGGIIWKAVLNVLGKIATAPFRALGALFGGGGEKFESVAFEAGDAQLTPPEREKLARLAAAVMKRPGLSLTVQGQYADADRLSLQERQLRRALAERAGQRVEAQDDPGPLSTRSTKVQAALESLFADRLGADELAAVKEGFRKANPGQLQENVAGRMMSRLSGLLREKRVLNEQEVAQLQGADLHAVLFERLRDGETVTPAQLQALARTRGENAVAALKAAGAPAERLAQVAPEKVDGAGREVPVKLLLGATPVSAGAN